jgi:hypothetical protein
MLRVYLFIKAQGNTCWVFCNLLLCSFEFWDFLFSFLGGFMLKVGVGNNEECQKGECASFTKSELHKNQYYCSPNMLKRAGDTKRREALLMPGLESREGCCCSHRKGGCNSSFCQAWCWRWVSKAQTSSAECRSVAMFMAEWLKDHTPKSQHFSYGEICVIIHWSRIFCLLALRTLQPYGIS